MGVYLLGLRGIFVVFEESFIVAYRLLYKEVIEVMDC
jgi:hypothetical protein